jgi:hypothetical protein
LTDRSKDSTRTKRETLVLQVRGWVDGPAPHHPEKNTHVLKNLDKVSDYPNSIEVDAETKDSTRKTEEKLDGRYKEGNERKIPK